MEGAEALAQLRHAFDMLMTRIPGTMISIGMLYLLTALTYVDQGYRIIKHRSVKDVSVWLMMSNLLAVVSLGITGIENPTSLEVALLSVYNLLMVLPLLATCFIVAWGIDREVERDYPDHMLERASCGMNMYVQYLPPKITVHEFKTNDAFWVYWKFYPVKIIWLVLLCKAFELFLDVMPLLKFYVTLVLPFTYFLVGGGIVVSLFLRRYSVAAWLILNLVPLGVAIIFIEHAHFIVLGALFHQVYLLVSEWRNPKPTKNKVSALAWTVLGFNVVVTGFWMWMLQTDPFSAGFAVSVIGVATNLTAVALYFMINRRTRRRRPI